MVQVGACVYCWGEQEQRRLLLDGLRPWAREALADGLALRFWYCRFDARGPHVLVLFATTAARREPLAAFLEDRIGDFLRRSPSAAPLEREVQLRRHHECRGKALCGEHLRPGLADNNTFALFDHPDDGYPFALSAGISARDEFWRRVGDATQWALEQLARGQTHTSALRVLAGVDGVLRRRRLPAQAYWRFHASTLLPGLLERLTTQPLELHAWLPRAIGARNLQAFERLWPEISTTDAAVAEAAAVAALADDGRPLQPRFALLRELNHNLLAQLGHAVRLHIPMVLYAWQRSSRP